MADTAFLTGATGFVGSNLARALVRRGFEVRALARPGSPRGHLDGVPVEWVEGHLLDREALARGLAGCRWAFHCAADYRLWVPDPESMFRSNVDGARAVLEAAGDAGVERIVHTSSAAAIPPTPGGSSSERDAYRSEAELESPYKRSKFLAERAALELASKGLPVVVVNPTAPVGPYDVKPTPTGRIVRDFLAGRMPAYVDTGLNLVHVADVAEGHLLAAEKGRPGERYILGGENLSLRRVLELLSELTGRPAPRLRLPHAAALAFAGAEELLGRLTGREPLAPLVGVRMAKRRWFYDHSKASRWLGYRPRPAREGLADAADWFGARAELPA